MEDQPVPPGPNKDGPWALSGRREQSIAAGAIAGVVTSVLCSPLDLLKTRQQVEVVIAARKGRTPRELSVINATRHVLETEGPRGLYRGLAPALMTVPVFWGCYFSLYDYSKRNVGSPSGPLRDKPLWIQHVTSAVAAGAFADTLTNPLWVLRTRLQTNALTVVDPNSANTSMLKEAQLLLRNESWIALFKGLPATLLGLSHVAIQFPLYEELKRHARARSSDGIESTASLVAASSVSKAVASALTYPHEVVRSRMQYDRTKGNMTLVGTVRTIVAESGFLGLYAGLRINMIRVVPACVTTFVTYEYIIAHFQGKL